MSTRQRRERARHMRRRAALCAMVLALGALSASQAAREKIGGAAREAAAGVASAFAGREAAVEELTLPAMRVYALQLGVYDNGELAQQEQQRLSQAGVPCIVWQRERMRIVCAAALAQAELDGAQSAGLETYPIEEEMPEVRLRLGAPRRDMEDVCALLTLPDAAFARLLQTEEAQPLDGVVQDARALATRAAAAHGESALYAQLAQSVVNWCALIEGTREEWGGELARQYAALTMCTLCRELRAELLAQASA